MRSFPTVSYRLRLNVSVEACEVKESFNVAHDQVVAGTILGTILLSVLVGTALDIVRRYVASPIADGHSSRGLKLLLINMWVAFSAYTNTSALLTAKVPDGAVRSLYGLKVISLIWIILAHAYLTLDLKAVGYLMKTQDVNRNFLFQLVINASLAVETFFFISGLLVTLAALRRLKTNPSMSYKEWIWFYIHRFVRMTPAVVLVIALLLAAYQLGDGPLWKEIIYPNAERCRENWWIHFLHISNFFDVSRMVRCYFIISSLFANLFYLLVTLINGVVR